MSFFEDDDAYTEEPGPPTRRYGADRNRQLLVRRAVGVAILVVVLILLLLGIKGCLDARKERGLENYVSDMTTVVQQSNQLSDRFFKTLQDPRGLDETAFEQQIAADRGTADTLLSQVEGIDTPGDLKDEQGEMELAFRLRAQAMDGITNNLDAAFGNQGSGEAIQKIAGYMRWFLASDVLYGRAHDEMNQTLSDDGIDGRLPSDQFLPDDSWLDTSTISSALAGVAGQVGRATPGVHGMALVAVTLNGVALPNGGAATITGGPPYELVAQVQNQGESTEKDVTVSYKFGGGISGERQHLDLEHRRRRDQERHDRDQAGAERR